MAQFIAFNREVEVNRQTVLSIVNSMSYGQEFRLALLKKNGIDPELAEWFNQQKWLDTFKAISEQLGSKNLFQIGKVIIDNASFPPLKGLEEALKSIDIAYHMNHRLRGQVMFDPGSLEMIEGIGHYTLVEFDPEAKTAIMVCNNPYPSDFDRGIITGVTRRFAGSLKVEVNLDLQKETRLQGKESCTYLITW